MAEINKIDYVGFTYNGVHSSQLGIVRVSDGSRYNEDLLPSSQDKTVQVPGGDGTYFFGSYFNQRQFNISYAFDSLTEHQINRIKYLFGDKKIHELVFDELPYKTYYAKVSGQANIKHIAFDEGASNRLYKGEGTISFVCYNPYARCFKNKMAEYKNASNYNEWKDGANFYEDGIQIDLSNNGIINVYNPGDKSADFILTLAFIDKKIYGGTIDLDVSKEAEAEGLELNEFNAQGSDTHIKINTKINLIEGYIKTTVDGKPSWKKSGNIYNQYIKSGDFFKIPVTVDKFKLINGKPDQSTGQINLSTNGSTGIAKNFESLEYDYYYL